MKPPGPITTACSYCEGKGHHISREWKPHYAAISYSLSASPEDEGWWEEHKDPCLYCEGTGHNLALFAMKPNKSNKMTIDVCSQKRYTELVGKAEDQGWTLLAANAYKGWFRCRYFALMSHPDPDAGFVTK